MTDPVADFLTRIRNGIHASHTTVDIPSSKLKKEMARILTEQGYISSYDVEAPTPDHPGEVIRVTLKYTEEAFDNYIKNELTTHIKQTIKALLTHEIQ